MLLIRKHTKPKLQILMLGNSLTAANHMPVMLAKELGAEVFVHARGGARLAEQLNPDTKMGALTAKALQNNHYDYVVLQEMSHGPATATERFLDSTRKLVESIRESGAEPVIYATWAFRPGCEKLDKMGMDAEEMHKLMQVGFAKAAEENDVILANVGEAFKKRGFADSLYAEDGRHPSKEGSALAASVIADAIRNNR